ncbi:MAG: hypothetical protein K1X79_07520 [Oligoflexia bacterium]|nr:hypothetical protein [Oligoflexia bacterium]
MSITLLDAKILVSRSSRHSQECGSMTLFFAAAILPLLFLVFSLSLDAGRYYTALEKWQKVLDEAVTYGDHFLPYQEQAETATRSYLAQFGASSAQVTVGADEVSALINLPVKLSFPQYFGMDLSIPLSTYSRARSTPFDSFVALDVSSYMGPSVFASTAWGDPAQWPPASFFEYEQPIVDISGVLNPLLVTQQCFNPVLSRYKESAQRAYEFLSHFSKNAVGVGVYPGYGTYIDVVRATESPDSRPVGGGEVDFDLYAGVHNRNVLCAAAAEREQAHAPYRFPTYNSALEPNSSGNSGVLILPASDPSQYQVNAAYLPALRAREVIWSQAVREGTLPETHEILRELRSQVVGAYFQGNRGGLSGNAVKSMFIFAGDVPWSLGARFPDAASSPLLQAQLAALRQDISDSGNALRISLTYVLSRHLGNDSPDLDARVDALKQLFSSESNQNLRLDVVNVSNFDDIERGVLAPVIMRQRTSVLAR